MFSDPVTVASTAFAFRIGERIALSIVVILVALVVTAGFWRSIQKVDFTLSKAGTSGGGTFVLATPVFALLALIGFAWVSFAHPITVAVPATAAERTAETAQAAGTVTMAGALPAQHAVAATSLILPVRDLPVGQCRRIRNGAAEAEVNPASWSARRLTINEA